MCYYINCEAIESLSIEINNNDDKIIILNIVYRPPVGDLEVCENYFQSILSNNSISKKVQNFVNLMLQFGLVPTINKPTRVTKRTISAIDHIIRNSVCNNDYNKL